MITETELVRSVTDENFADQVLARPEPVLVDFWAQWCGPCLMLAPTIDELATLYQGKAKVGKVDVDQAAGLATTYKIQNIPTVLIFDKGQQVERIVGAKHKRDYQASIDARLPK